VNVAAIRHEIAQTQHALKGFQRERDGLAALPPADWATNTLRRARQGELAEFIAEGEALVAGLTAQMTTAEHDQAAELARLEPVIAEAMARLAALVEQAQTLLDELEPLMERHTRLGGGRWAGWHHQARAALWALAERTGHFTCQLDAAHSLRLVRLAAKHWLQE
jgi:hypothetical protein